MSVVLLDGKRRQGGPLCPDRHQLVQRQCLLVVLLLVKGIVAQIHGSESVVESQKASKTKGSVALSMSQDDTSSVWRQVCFSVRGQTIRPRLEWLGETRRFYIDSHGNDLRVSLFPRNTKVRRGKHRLQDHCCCGSFVHSSPPHHHHLL